MTVFYGRIVFVELSVKPLRLYQKLVF